MHERINSADYANQQKLSALAQTEEAQHIQSTLQNILIARLDEDPTVQWDRLMDLSDFSEARPDTPVQPEPPIPKPLPEAPKLDGYLRRVKLSLIDQVF